MIQMKKAACGSLWVISESTSIWHPQGHLYIYRNRMFHGLEKIMKSRPKFIDNILYLPRWRPSVIKKGSASQLTFGKWQLSGTIYHPVPPFPILVFSDLGHQPGRQHTRHASFVIVHLIWLLLEWAKNINTILAWPCVVPSTEATSFRPWKKIDTT